LRTNFGSVMGWMIWFYSAYFILLAVELWFAMRADLAACAQEKSWQARLCNVLTFGRKDTSPPALERDHNILRVLGSLGVPLAIAFHGGVGALFGVVGARPYWNSGLTPVMFLIGALASGGALLTFVTAIWGPNRGADEHRKLVALLGQLVLGLLAFDLLLEWAEYSIGLYSSLPAESDGLRLVLFGPYWWAFWGVHLLLGSLIPLLLLVFGGRSVVAVATAGALIAITFLSVRLNIVIPAQAIEELQGLRNAFTGPGLSFDYFPSLMEWLFFLWTVSLAGLVFLIGYNLLPIVRTPIVRTEEVA
jgi:protein NrfD